MYACAFTILPFCVSFFFFRSFHPTLYPLGILASWRIDICCMYSWLNNVRSHFIFFFFFLFVQSIYHCLVAFFSFSTLPCSNFILSDVEILIAELSIAWTFVAWMEKDKHHLNPKYLNNGMQYKLFKWTKWEKNVIKMETPLKPLKMEIGTGTN